MYNNIPQQAHTSCKEAVQAAVTHAQPTDAGEGALCDAAPDSSVNCTRYDCVVNCKPAEV